MSAAGYLNYINTLTAPTATHMPLNCPQSVASSIGDTNNPSANAQVGSKASDSFDSDDSMGIFEYEEEGLDDYNMNEGEGGATDLDGNVGTPLQDEELKKVEGGVRGNSEFIGLGQSMVGEGSTTTGIGGAVMPGTPYLVVGGASGTVNTWNMGGGNRGEGDSLTSSSSSQGHSQPFDLGTEEVARLLGAMALSEITPGRSLLRAWQRT